MKGEWPARRVPGYQIEVCFLFSGGEFTQSNIAPGMGDFGYYPQHNQTIQLFGEFI